MLQMSIEVCGGKENLPLMGVIRNMRESREAGEGFVYGLQFVDLNRFQQVLLCSYALTELTEELI